MTKVAVVTGSSAGVGRATARHFAEKGYDVALLARGEAGLQAAAKEIEAAGARAIPINTDVADADAVEAAASRIEQTLGPIDVWVNDAFAGAFAPFREIEAGEYRRVTEVTYLGSVNGTRSALARMRPRNRGTIVQVGSALAYRGIPLQSAYCGAKHAMQGFNESLRSELMHEKSNVKVTMVQLPALNTPQFSWGLSRMPNHPQPVPPIYQPEVAARAIVWAAEHPRRREYWVGATTAATVLANAVAPGALDRYLGKTGFKSQQTSEPADSHRPHNLWQPVDQDSDFGAHGEFDSRARAASPQWSLTKRRGLIYSGLAAAAAAGVAAARRSR